MSLTSFRREEYTKKKRTEKQIRYAFFFLLFVLFVALLSYLSHRQNIRISEVELSGQVLVTQEEIQKETLSFLQGKYIWLFPKNNVFLYPRAALMKDLREHFKRIDTLSVRLKNYHTLSVTITERKPFAIWCDTLPDPSLPANPGPAAHCYFMDTNSTIFAEAPQFSGDAYFKYYGRIESDMPIGKEYIATTTQFAEVAAFIRTVQNLSIRPQYLVAEDNGEYVLVLSGGAKIYFDMREPLQKTGENLVTLLRSPVFAGSRHIDLPVDYIDLRFGNKLFYKLKN